MAVSDLTNTTWLINEVPIVEEEYAEYHINFTSNNMTCMIFALKYEFLLEESAETSIIYTSSGSTISAYNSTYGGWDDNAYRTITITGGTDATNSNLIAWLEANATQQVAPTPSTTNNIFFGNSSINKVYFGTSEVSKIYYGNTLIYEVGGEPTPTFDPVLANNSWDMIKLASKSNAVPSSWAVGDTKSLVINNMTYQARLVDTTGKYVRVSDNSTAYLKFELTACLPTKEKFNSSSNNRPAQSTLLIDINSGTIYNTIDSSLLSVIEPVKVKVSQGGGSSTQDTIIDYEAKFFLQREHDLYNVKYSCVMAEYSAISAQDEYYIANNTNTARIKQISGTNSAYLLMSPSGGSSTLMCVVTNSGIVTTADATYTRGVALCFAL